MATVHDMTASDLQKLLDNKKLWETADEKKKQELNESNIALRGTYGITSDNYSASDLENIIAYRNSQDIQSQIRDGYALQEQVTLNNLKKAMNSSMSNLGAEKATIKPKYYQARNDVSTQSKMNAKEFQEYLASTGQAISGTNNQARIANNVATQGAIGSLKQSEAEEFSDIARRESDIKNAYEMDVASAKAGTQAQLLQALVNQANADRGYALDEKQVNASIEAQNITNEINRLKLQNLPQELKYGLELLEQQIRNGEISIEAGQLQLDQLKNGGSAYSSGASQGETPTPDNILQFEKLKDIFFDPNGRFGGNRIDMLDNLVKDANVYKNVLGEQLYNDLLEEVRGFAPQQTETDLKPFKEYIKSQFISMVTNTETGQKVEHINQEQIRSYVKNLREKGYITDEDADMLLATYGM